MLLSVVDFLPQLSLFNSFQLNNISAHEHLSCLLSRSDSESYNLPYSILFTLRLQSPLPFELLKEGMLDKEKLY